MDGPSPTVGGVGAMSDAQTHLEDPRWDPDQTALDEHGGGECECHE